MSQPSLLSDVAIVIPSYNAGPSLIKAIESVFDATQLSIQVVIIEDGSNEPCEEMLKTRFSNLLNSKNSPHYIQYHQQPNSGAYHARLNALKLCHSSYVKFLDQDDVLISGALAQEVAAFDEETDVVISNWRINHAAEDRIEHCSAPVYTAPINDFLTVGGCFTSAALYRTSLAQKVLQPVDSFTPVKADDWLIFAQICLSGARYKTIEVESYVWNQHEDQLSKKAADQLLKEHYLILDFCEKKLLDTDQLTQERKELLANYYAKQLINCYEKDTSLFEKTLLKIQALNPKYRTRHGHRIYQSICNLMGLRNGTKAYSTLKALVRFKK